MTPVAIPNDVARRLFLSGQGLCEPPKRKLDAPGLLALIERLGFVQVDSIRTVERAHDMILFARNQTYRQKLLKRLLEREASLFENWTHDAAIIPTRFYPYWQAHFANERERLRDRWREWRREGFEEALEGILERVRDQGPTMARDLEAPDGGRKGGPNGSGWWDWHPGKTALEYHWRTGALAVARRDSFQKVYDLAERVIPEQHRKPAPERDAVVDWACRSALERLGFATHGEIAAFWGLIPPAAAAAWCKARAGSELLEILVEPAPGTEKTKSRPRAAYAFPELLDRVATPPDIPGRLRVLSPFDPLLRDRNRCQRLFGFEYRIEVFVPEAKRRYGYYVFPLLEGDRFVGRIDMKHERARDCLHVKALWPEPGLRWTKGRQRALESELERQRRFTGAACLTFADGYLKPAGPPPD